MQSNSQEPRTKLQYSPCINSSHSLPQSTRFSFCVSNKCAGTLCFYDYGPLFGAVKANNVKHFRTFRMRLQCKIKCSCMWVLLGYPWVFTKDFWCFRNFPQTPGFSCHWWKSLASIYISSNCFPKSQLDWWPRGHLSAKIWEDISY